VISVEYRDWLMGFGADTLNALFRTSHVYDMGDNITLPYIEPVDQLETFVERVSQAKTGAGHTDMLFISKRLEGAQKVVQVVEGYRAKLAGAEPR
jgi:hypothetical protein